MSSKSARSQTLVLRVTPAAKLVLAAAAAADNLSLSEFVLDSALSRAEETLSVRGRFGLDAERWGAFLAALDADPRPLPNIEKLFSAPSPFDAGVTS